MMPGGVLRNSLLVQSVGRIRIDWLPEWSIGIPLLIMPQMPHDFTIRRFTMFHYHYAVVLFAK
jgi:hypothetical protein